VIQFPAGTENIFFLGRSSWLWGKSALLFNGNLGFFPEGKRPIAEANHLHSSKAGVNNEWTYTSTLPYTFMRRIQNMEMKNNFLLFELKN